MQQQKEKAMNTHDVSNIEQANAKAESNFGNFMARLLARVTGPMPILGGSGLPPMEGKPGRKVTGVDADPVLLERTKNLRKKNESMMEFFARTLIGAHAIRTASKEELARMYQVAISNPEYRENETVVFETFTPRRPPTRFILTD
jgi:hypothetical protein